MAESADAKGLNPEERDEMATNLQVIITCDDCGEELDPFTTDGNRTKARKVAEREHGWVCSSQLGDHCEDCVDPQED